MRCPYCRFKVTKVIETRESEEDVIRRRRECEQCEKRFTTYEKVENLSVSIVKKNQERQQYNREKLKRGVALACEKRPIPAARVEKLLDEVEAEIRQLKVEELESMRIGEMVMNRLKDIDEVAYIRFASVYRKFADINAFKEEFNRLVQEREQEIKKR